EVHRGRGLGLPVQAGGHRAVALRAPGLAASLNGAAWPAAKVGILICSASRREPRWTMGISLMDNSEVVNILVVDDVQEKRLVYEAVLAPLGQNLVTAKSGREALRYLLDREFAVILLDVHMPDIDGFETAAMIRSRRQTAHTPIIFVTAFND